MMLLQRPTLNLCYEFSCLLNLGSISRRVSKRGILVAAEWLFKSSNVPIGTINAVLDLSEDENILQIVMISGMGLISYDD